jgi:hypothetical protein
MIAREPNTARKEQISMPRDFRSDPPFAAQQLLWLRKPQMRVEKADQNGNDYRAVNHDPNPRRRVSWPRARRLPGTGRGLIPRPPFPPETHAETLANALTHLAPHTAGTRQTPMNTDFLPVPILTARPPLYTRKPPIAIEKAKKNGNHCRQEC